jgi:hypothetical protein
MPELPEYQPNQQVTPGPLVNSAPIYQGYAKLADQVEETTRPLAQQLRDQQVQHQATIAGQNDNFHTIPSFGEAAQVYNEAGLAANKQQVTSDIIQNLTQFHQEAATNPNAQGVPQGVTTQSASQFAEKTTAYMHGLLSTVPQENRQYAKNLLANTATTYQSKLSATLYKQQQENSLLDWNSTHATLMGQVQSLNKEGRFHDANVLMAQGNLQTQSAMQHLGMSEKQAATTMEQDRQDHLLSRAQGQLNGMLNDPMAPLTPEAKKQQIKDYLHSVQNNPDFLGAFNNPFKQKRAMGVLQNQVNQFYQKDKVNQADLSTQISAANSQAYHTGSSNNSFTQQLMSNLSPQKQQEVQYSLDANAFAGQLMKNISNGSVTNIDSHLDDIKNQRSNLDFKNDPIGANIQDKVLASHQDEIKKMIEDKKKNPMNFLPQNESFMRQAQNIIDNPKKYPDTGGALSELKINYMKAQGYRENQYQLMQIKQASDWANKISNATPEEFLSMIPEIQKEVGNDPKYMNYFMQECHQADNSFNPSNYYFYGITRTNEGMAQAQTLSAAFKQPISVSLKGAKDSTGKAVTQESLYSAIDNNKVTAVLKASGVGNDYIAPSINAAAQFAAYKIWQGTDPATATSQAQQLFFTGNYQVDTLGNTSYVIPKTDGSGNKLDVNTTHDLLKGTMENNLLNGNISVPKSFPYAGSEAVRKMAYANELMSNYRVIRSGSTSFNYMDSRGQIVKDNSGQPLQLNYSDITNPNSAQQRILRHAKEGRVLNFISPGLGDIKEDIRKAKQSVQLSHMELQQGDKPVPSSWWESQKDTFKNSLVGRLVEKHDE